MKRKADRKKKHSVILRVLVLCVSIYMVFSLTGLYKTYNESRKELKALTDRYNVLKAEVDNKRDLLENGSREQIIEQAARERLGYVYSNEEIYTDISGD